MPFNKETKPITLNNAFVPEIKENYVREVLFLDSIYYFLLYISIENEHFFL